MEANTRHAIVSVMTVLVGISIILSNWSSFSELFKEEIECEQKKYEEHTAACIKREKAHLSDEPGELRNRCKRWAASRYCWIADN